MKNHKRESVNKTWQSLQNIQAIWSWTFIPDTEVVPKKNETIYDVGSLYSVQKQNKTNQRKAGHCTETGVDAQGRAAYAPQRTANTPPCFPHAGCTLHFHVCTGSV